MKLKTIPVIGALLLCACASQPAAPEETETEQTAESLSVTESTQTETALTETQPQTTVTEQTTAVSSETAAEVPASRAPVFTYDYSENRVTADDDPDRTLYIGTRKAVSFPDAGNYPQLENAVNSLMQEIDGFSHQVEKDYIESANELYANDDALFNEYDLCLTLTEEVSVIRCDEDIFSFVVMVDEFGGGVHNFWSYYAYNLRVSDGTLITLDDLTPDKQGVRKAVAEKLTAKYDPEIFWQESADATLAETYGEDLCGYTSYSEDGEPWEHGAMNFVLTPTGVVFFSNIYDITYFAAGQQSAELSFDEFPDLINGEYAPKGDEYSLYLRDDNVLNHALLKTEFGTKDVVINSVFGEREDGDYGFVNFEVRVDGEAHTIDIDYPEGDTSICYITARIDHTPDSDTIHIFDYKGRELASQTL